MIQEEKKYAHKWSIYVYLCKYRSEYPLYVSQVLSCNAGNKSLPRKLCHADFYYLLSQVRWWSYFCSPHKSGCSENCVWVASTFVFWRVIDVNSRWSVKKRLQLFLILNSSLVQATRVNTGMGKVKLISVPVTLKEKRIKTLFCWCAMRFCNIDFIHT